MFDKWLIKLEEFLRKRRAERREKQIIKLFEEFLDLYRKFYENRMVIDAKRLGLI